MILDRIFKHFNRKKLTNENYSFIFDENFENEYVVFDTETTGLNTKIDEILSIGAIKIRDNKIITSEKFEIFLKSDTEISQDSIKIHQIRNIDLKDGYEPHVAIEKFLHFIEGRPLVGYYLKFDVDMINRYLKSYIGVKLPNRQIEVSKMYYNMKIKSMPHGGVDLRFDSIMNDLGLPIFGKHDAINDAIMTAMVYLKLNKTVN